MELSEEQLAFLLGLRQGAQRAAAAMDAGVIGPLIRANLVRWEDDPSETARQRDPPGSVFTLTVQGEQWLAQCEAQRATEQGC